MLEKVDKHASGFIGALNRLFSGIALGSIQNAESKTTKKSLKTLSKSKI